jgi:origin recognition complex subunit 5
MLFEQAIDQWSGFSKTDYLTACKVDNIHQFICYIRDGLMIKKNEKEYRVEIGKEQTNYLVLDRAERLRTMPPTILPSLLRLAELVNMCFMM